MSNDTRNATHVRGCRRDRTGVTRAHECGGEYTCPRCERLLGWCIGAADGTPALCDECAVFVQDGWSAP